MFGRAMQGSGKLIPETDQIYLSVFGSNSDEQVTDKELKIDRSLIPSQEHSLDSIEQVIGETQDSPARSGEMVQVKSSSTLDLQKDGQTPKQLNTDDSDKALPRPFLNNVSQSTYYD